VAIRVIDELLSLINCHESWRGKECLNLIPSENIMSPMVHSLLSSDLGHRYTSRDGFYKGTRFIDKIEQYGEKLAKDLFRSETAELRPLSGHIADLIFLACFTKSEDKVLCVSTENGGYPGFGENGLSRLLRYRMIPFPFSKTDMNIKTEEASDLILREKPAVIIFGASMFLFSHPVQELTKTACDVGSHIAYDGSHVLGLIAGEEFQDPLREGCSVLLGSTHKTFFGPQGGIILADQEHGEAIKERIFPEFVDNAHWNRIAATTLALVEMKTYGKEYAREIVKNAQTLAKALDDEGFPVACPHLGCTRSHQVLLYYENLKEGAAVAKRLEKANIITDKGIRLGVCEATRRGMKGKEMQKIASFIKRVILDKEDPNRIKREIVNFVKEYQEVKFCFE
jgi:glycine hydroxymethyltransferase